MKRHAHLLAALCLALAPAAAFAAIGTPVQRGAVSDVGPVSSASVTTTAFATNELIYYQCRADSTMTITAISLNGGANDIGNFTTSRTASGVLSLQTGYRILPSGLSAGSVAFTFDVAANVQCIVYGVTGVDTTTPASATNSGTGTGNPTLAVTPTAASDMVIASLYVRDNGTWTRDTGSAGFTELANSNFSIGRQVAEYKLNAGASSITYSGTTTGTDAWMQKMTAFKEAGGAAASVGSRSLLGVGK